MLCRLCMVLRFGLEALMAMRECGALLSSKKLTLVVLHNGMFTVVCTSPNGGEDSANCVQ